jgi:hypothetical protein
MDAPTYDTLNELRNELKSNASSIPTSRGGGGHGYLGLILSADDYNNAVGQPFNLPVAPPLQPNHPAGATAAQIAEANRQHAENVREWREYNNIQAALRKQLFNAVEDVYVSAIKSPLTGYNNLSVHDILKHLFTSYGKIPPSRASQNAQDLYKPWDANTPFEHLIKQIQDCRDIAAAANQPFSNEQILKRRASPREPNRLLPR